MLESCQHSKAQPFGRIDLRRLRQGWAAKARLIHARYAS
jgi:hypothetical protein